MRMSVAWASLLALLAAAAAVADSITLDGITYGGVYVRESPSRYYVQIPSTGRSLSASKSSIDPSSVSITPDKTQRDALLLQWRIANGLGNTELPERHDDSLRSHGSPTVQPNPIPRNTEVTAGSQNDARLKRTAPLQAHHAAAEPIVIAPRRDSSTSSRSVLAEQVTDGRVQRIKLDDVRLKHALDALLRPLNLDYEVHDGFIWISTAEKIRTESFEPLEMRTLHLKNAGGEILPKVGVANIGGWAGTLSGGGGYDQGYGARY